MGVMLEAGPSLWRGAVIGVTIRIAGEIPVSSPLVAKGAVVHPDSWLDVGSAGRTGIASDDRTSENDDFRILDSENVWMRSAIWAQEGKRTREQSPGVPDVFMIESHPLTVL